MKTTGLELLQGEKKGRYLLPGMCEEQKYFTKLQRIKREYISPQCIFSH